MAEECNQMLENLQMFVLDVLRYDIEQVPSITKLLNNTSCVGWRKFWPHDFTEGEVIRALGQLVSEGLVQVLCYDDQQKELVASEQTNFAGPLDGYWFRLAVSGRAKWEEWKPPSDNE